MSSTKKRRQIVLSDDENEEELHAVGILAQNSDSKVINPIIEPTSPKTENKPITRSGNSQLKRQKLLSEIKNEMQRNTNLSQVLLSSDDSDDELDRKKPIEILDDDEEAKPLTWKEKVTAFFDPKTYQKSKFFKDTAPSKYDKEDEEMDRDDDNIDDFIASDGDDNETATEDSFIAKDSDLEDSDQDESEDDNHSETDEDAEPVIKVTPLKRPKVIVDDDDDEINDEAQNDDSGDEYEEDDDDDEEEEEEDNAAFYFRVDAALDRIRDKNSFGSTKDNKMVSPRFYQFFASNCHFV